MKDYRVFRFQSLLITIKNRKTSLMKALFASFLLILFMGGIQEGDHATMVKRMAPFDRAMIPLWGHLQEQNMPKAKRAVLNVAFQWQRMENHLKNAYPERVEWAATFERVEHWLDDVYAAVDYNCAALALNQLGHVKYELAVLRSQYGIEYYFDDLYELEEQIAWVAEVADDAMLCLFEWQEFEALVDQLNQSWVEVNGKEINAAIYELDKKQMQRLRLQQKRVDEKLDYFNQELACANREEVAVAALAVEEAIRGVIQVFGAFEANRTYFADKQ